MFRLSCVIDFAELLKIATAVDELGTGKSKSPNPGTRKRQPETRGKPEPWQALSQRQCFQKEGCGSSCHIPPSSSRNGHKTWQHAVYW